MHGTLNNHAWGLAATRETATSIIDRKTRVMAITSKDIKEPTRRDYSLVLGRAGVLLALVAFGGIIFAINGGFSVLGLEHGAQQFNAAGRIFWAIVSRWRFSTPAVVGLPSSQPIIPWVGVTAATILQIVVIYRRLTKKKIPLYMIVTALALSFYDLATTFYGLRQVNWAASAGIGVQVFLTIVITFAFEFAVSISIKELT